MASIRRLSDRLNMHRDFWLGVKRGFPIASFRIGDFFFASHFEAGRQMLSAGRDIDPNHCNPKDFIVDYRRMFQVSEIVDQDAFWTAEPYTGFPWMEAILGCPVVPARNAFTTSPIYQTLSEALEGVQKTVSCVSGTAGDFWLSDLGRDRNPWLSLYLNFLSLLVAESQGRYPLGQPITRGLSDMFGAILGQSALVFALQDEPAKASELIQLLCRVFTETMRLHAEIVPDFHGGRALGFYNVWTPGESLWFQDDLSAILSPDLYRRFFIPSIRKICGVMPYNAMHLHSSSFFILDDLLEIESLSAIEVNKDIGGMSLKEMMPILQKIQKRKKLIIWGDLDSKDIGTLKTGIDPTGLFLNVVAPDTSEAIKRNKLIKEW